MSDTNGTSEPTLTALKEQVERARLQAELKHIKATESAIDGAQDFVNPAEPLFDSPDFIYPWYGENIPFNLDNRLRGELLPVYITEYGLKILRDYSRWLMAYNPWAIQIRENKISYICGKGFGYTCAPVERKSDSINGDKALCKIAQRFLDRFMERTNWGAWEQQLIAKDTCDGEAFLRFFHLGRGEVTVRPVEPEHVRSPGDQEAHQSFGIETPQNDILDVKAFWIVEDPSYKWFPTQVPADQVLHIRSNVGPTAKRGYPCLIPVRQNLSRAANLLKIMSVLASSQSSISMIRKWKQYSVQDIQGFQQINSDFQFTDPISGQQRFIKRYLPGTALDTPENLEYEFPASKIAAAALVEVLQAELRAIASRFNWPEYMVGADASNANYASTQVAEAPGVKQLEREQASYARAFGDGTFSGPAQCGALWRVLMLGVRWGGLPREILRRVKLQAEGPSLVARDKEKETQRAQTLHQAGRLSGKTWDKWEGLDTAQEQEAIEAEKPEPQEMQPGQQQGQQLPGQPPAEPGTVRGGTVSQSNGQAPAKSPVGEGGAYNQPDLSEDDLQTLDRVWATVGRKKFKEGNCVRNATGHGYHDDQTGYPCTNAPQDVAPAQKPAGQPQSSSQGGTDPKAVQMMKELTRKEFSEKDLHTLGGAVEGAQTTIRPGKSGKTVVIEVNHPDYFTKRVIMREGDRLLMYNSKFFIKPNAQGKGLGTKIFAQQVQAARKLGIDALTTAAVGAAGEKENGYYTWPRLGYDGELKRVQIARLPSQFAGVKRVSELMATPEGTKAWKEHGGDVECEFDLRDGSKSMAVLSAYLAERGKGKQTQESFRRDIRRLLAECRR